MRQPHQLLGGQLRWILPLIIAVTMSGASDGRRRRLEMCLNGAVDIANRRQAWALLPRVGESANANLSGVITGRVSVLASPAVTCGPG